MWLPHWPVVIDSTEGFLKRHFQTQIAEQAVLLLALFRVILGFLGLETVWTFGEC